MPGVIHMKIRNWKGREVEIAESKGGVIALVNPYDNLISTGISPWPPPEIVQKLYQSAQSKAYAGDQKRKSTSFFGYYSDLQSIHSEDAITWSVFGTVAHAKETVRNKWVQDFFETIGIEAQDVNQSEISLWRRIPHPDSFVSGGPEIDFEIYTGHVLLLGEAKWHSAIASTQGKNKDKDQIQLRIEFLNKYGRKLFPLSKIFVVLAIGLTDIVPTPYVVENVLCVSTTWEEVCGIDSHPMAEELRRYFVWKKENSKDL